ncbi:hypothetical protein [Mesorhizobium neociceri]|uniref:Uncharacterized protein n=1 Tax=Mesorhizobium neociceri TaxID=1307853 RepID=A0A838AY79_9HYPH|nr:hypothetical protein [Mesorhizobium neociceri]MBA1139498.1 hypothetical protein [Mesorhizobium neociceri]
MDLKSFVTESLSQILDGIKEAQQRPGGDNVGADGYLAGQGNLISGGTSGFFTLVDFDVSVIAESREGGNSVRVSTIEVDDGSSKSASNTSRVKFTVHVRIPKGGANRDRSTQSMGRAETDFDVFSR